MRYAHNIRERPDGERLVGQQQSGDRIKAGAADRQQNSVEPVERVWVRLFHLETTCRCNSRVLAPLTTGRQTDLTSLVHIRRMSHIPLHLIPRAIADDRRRNRRIDVLLSVQVDTDQRPRAGRLKELSRCGARLEFAGQLRVDQTLILRRAGVELEGRVAWCDGQTAGLEFARPLDEASFLQMRRGDC